MLGKYKILNLKARSFALCIIVAITAFLSGIILIVIVKDRYLKLGEKMSSIVPMSDRPILPLDEVPSDWKRIKVVGLMTLSLPPNAYRMKTISHNRKILDELYRSEDTSSYMPAMFRFEYGKHVYQADCDDPSLISKDKAPTSFHGIVVGGKKAWVQDRDSKVEVRDIFSADGRHWPKLRVCFPQVSNGKRLYVEISSEYSYRLNELRPIINSIKFIK